MSIPYFRLAKGSRNFIAQTCEHEHATIEEAFQYTAVSDKEYGPSRLSGDFFDRIIDHTNETVKELTPMGGGRWSMIATLYGRIRYGLGHE